MARGQITIFIIVGMLVLIVGGIVLYFTDGNTAKKMQLEKELIQSLFREKGKYHNYIISCLDQSAKEALILSGYQGGVIYDTQMPGAKFLLGPERGYPYGKHVLPFKPFPGKDVTFLVNYGITRPETGTKYHPNIPDYPYGQTRLVPEPRALDTSYVNTLGNFPLPGPFPPLCDSYGANRKGVSAVVYTCETYDSTNPIDKNSVQEMLQIYISNKTSECVKFDSLPELKNLNIRKGNVTTNLTFGDQHIYIDVDFPVMIQMGASSLSFKLQDFRTSFNIRLKKIHELASHLIKEDVNNIFFNIVVDAKKLNDCRNSQGANDLCLKPGMKVKKLADVCPSCGAGAYDDILLIEDNESLIDGTPYVFAFAIQNRAPALDLVRQNMFSTMFGIYDYILTVNQSLNISPFGFDPDEDFHNEKGYMDDSYRYGLWKEDYDEYFDEVACRANQMDCQLRPETYVRRVPTGEPPPKNFTKSDIYKATRRQASYKVQWEDSGAHSLKVEVCDKGNLCDYQILRILVQNKPVLGAYQPYHDIPWQVASIEDNYWLTVFLIGGMLEGADRYLWRDLITESGIWKGWQRMTTEPNISLPYDSFDIINITPQQFNITGTHPITLQILGPGAPPPQLFSDEMQLEVKTCLPHRSLEPPYPFNTSDPFMANHSCCAGEQLNPSTYQLIPAGTECYKGIEYGCRDLFKPITRTRHIGPTYYDNGFSVPNKDVYMRTVTGTCDGKRGNICNGTSYEEVRHFKDCDERCSECVPGSMDCQPSPSGTVCGAVAVCAPGGGVFYDETNPSATIPGARLCYGGCAEVGSCSVTTACTCNVAICGATCDSTLNHKWTGNICSYSCNSGTCEFDNSRTICEYPSSYCQDAATGRCIYNVGCTDTGIQRTLGEFCLAPGTINPNPDNDWDDRKSVCFYADSAGGIGCNEFGSCTTKENFPVDCTLGDPGSGDRYCLFNTTTGLGCHYGASLCQADKDGWDLSTMSIDCTFTDGQSYCMKTETVPFTDAFGAYDECHFNIQCSSIGLQKSTTACHRTTYGTRDSGICWYEQSGIKNSRQDDCGASGCGSIRSCVLIAGRECTENGCTPY